MSRSKHKETEALTRREAAERLTDIAYALTAGGPLRLEADGQIDVPIADRLVLKRKANSKDGRVVLELELSWSIAAAAASAPEKGKREGFDASAGPPRRHAEITQNE